MELGFPTLRAYFNQLSIPVLRPVELEGWVPDLGPWFANTKCVFNQISNPVPVTGQDAWRQKKEREKAWDPGSEIAVEVSQIKFSIRNTQGVLHNLGKIAVLY